MKNGQTPSRGKEENYPFTRVCFEFSKGKLIVLIFSPFVPQPWRVKAAAAELLAGTKIIQTIMVMSPNVESFSPRFNCFPR